MPGGRPQGRWSEPTKSLPPYRLVCSPPLSALVASPAGAPCGGQAPATYCVHADLHASLPFVLSQGECAEVETQLREARAGAAAGQLRQQELEHELAQAVQQRESSEAASKAGEQRAAAEAERLAAELALAVQQRESSEAARNAEQQRAAAEAERLAAELEQAQLEQQQLEAELGINAALRTSLPAERAEVGHAACMS